MILSLIAEIGIGDMFAGMLFPGLILAALYILYILIRCTLDPKSGPRRRPVTIRRLQRNFGSPPWLPPTSLIFAVRDDSRRRCSTKPLPWVRSARSCSHFTETSRSLLKEAILKTISITAMILTILLGGTMFSSVFIGSGGYTAAEEIIEVMQLGGWGTLFLILILVFLAGFVMDVLSIILIVVLCRAADDRLRFRCDLVLHPAVDRSDQPSPPPMAAPSSISMPSRHQKSHSVTCTAA